MNMDQHDKVTKKLSERFLFLDFVMSVELLLSKNLKLVLIFHSKYIIILVLDFNSTVLHFSP